MTRDTHDDLFISYRILNDYLAFLEYRINVQIESIENSFSKLHLDSLSAEDREYVFETYKRHHEDSKEFKNVITIIQRSITTLNDRYPNTIRFYSKNQYGKNLNDHKKVIEEIIYQLRKNG